MPEIKMTIIYGKVQLEVVHFTEEKRNTKFLQFLELMKATFECGKTQGNNQQVFGVMEEIHRTQERTIF
jgi:hypothetical protein